MLLISLEGQLILLKPCPFCSYQQYHLYLGLIGDRSIGDIATDDNLWAILQRLINLHPRGDIDGHGFDLPSDYIFVADIVSQIKELNRVDPIPKQKKPKSYMELAPESSGDTEIDVLADLANIFGYSEAISITKSMGLNQINKLIARHNEINKPREERAQEKMTEDLNKWAQEDPKWFDDLGVKAE